MTPAARMAAAIECLDAIACGAAAEKVLTTWARQNRFAGSKDRAALRDLVYEAVRRWRSCAWLGGGETGRARVLGLCRARGIDPGEVFTGAGYAPPPLSAEEAAAGPPLEAAPEAVRLDVQDWLLPLLRAALGEDTGAVLEALRDRAEVGLRVNTLKADRDGVITEVQAAGHDALPHRLGPTAIRILGEARGLTGLDGYRAGRFELQDAASQAVVDRLAPWLKGAAVLDYCAGGGGKALAMAGYRPARMVAHDGDPRRMADLPDRARRAGAGIETVTRPEGMFDVVLCDAPCSGSGAWRRQPQAKWLLTPEGLAALTRTQDEILAAAAPLVAPGGVLAYATCSLLREENEDRAGAFLDAHPGWEAIESMRLSPLDGGDGFFLSIFTRHA